MKVIVPPLKSQGIKTKLVPWIIEQIPERRGKWIEPFLGTGVVAFNVAFDEALLSDINLHVINFYKAIHSGEITPERVLRFLKEEHTKLRNAGDKGYDHYRLIRDRFNTAFAPLDLLFLNRAGFNGMMRFSKGGRWNIPFCQKPERFRDAYVTKIINQVKAVKLRMKPQWQLISLPFQEVIAMAGSSDIIYCDPPYYGRYTDYFNKWNGEQEEALYQSLKKTPARFILSTWHHNDFRANESIEKYWKNFRIETKRHFYHAGAKEENRREIFEALVMNFDKPNRPQKPEKTEKAEEMLLAL